MLADGHGPSEVQKEANIAYHQLTSAEKERLRKEADKENSANPVDFAWIPRQRLTGLLQQTVTWYKIRHTGGQAHYYSRTRTLKQRQVKLDWLWSLRFNVSVRE